MRPCTAIISSRSRTRRSATTWSCARSAPATRGRCSACRRSGTRPRPIASRAVKDPRGVLADFGVDAAGGHRNPGVGFDRRDALPRAADASRGHRGLERGAARRAGHARLDDRHRVSEDAGRAVMNGVHDMGGMDGLRQGRGRSRTSRCSTPTGKRALALVRAMGAAGAFNIDTSRFYREALPPDDYLSSTYYKKWLPAWRTCWSTRARRRRRGQGRPCASGRAKPPHAQLSPTRSSALWCAASPTRDQHRAALFRPATACARRTSIPRRTRACRATCAAMSAWSTRSRLPRVSGFDSRSRRARTRNGSTRWCSTAPSCGAPDADPTVKISIDAFEPYLEPA